MTFSTSRGSVLARGTFAACALVFVSSLSGCKAPEPAPIPATPAVPTEPVFDPADYIVHGEKLPGTYRVTGITSGEILTIQGVSITQNGSSTVKRYGVPETVHLAGIVAPAPGQPGWKNTVDKVNSWLAGKDDLIVEADAKFPLDLEKRRMVQIYFSPKARNTNSSSASKSTSSSASSPSSSSSGVQWNLNRMLIHTGYAVVDLYGATSIDVQKWLNDEEFAKTYVDPKTKKLKPLGLWGLGVVMPQRDRSALPSSGSAGSKPGIVGGVTTNSRPSTVVTSQSMTSTTSSTQSVAPTSPNATSPSSVSTTTTTSRTTEVAPATSASSTSR